MANGAVGHGALFFIVAMASERPDVVQNEEQARRSRSRLSTPDLRMSKKNIPYRDILVFNSIDSGG